MWDGLPEGERPGAIAAYDVRVTDWELPCTEAGGTYERTLYVLAVTGARLTPGQVAYVMLARWYRNTDPAAIRAKLAAMVQKGHALWTRDGRYYATEEGIAHLRMVEQAWRSRQRAAAMHARRPAPAPPQR